MVFLLLWSGGLLRKIHLPFFGLIFVESFFLLIYLFIYSHMQMSRLDCYMVFVVWSRRAGKKMKLHTAEVAHGNRGKRKRRIEWLQRRKGRWILSRHWFFFFFFKMQQDIRWFWILPSMVWMPLNGYDTWLFRKRSILETCKSYIESSRGVEPSCSKRGEPFHQSFVLDRFTWASASCDDLHKGRYNPGRHIHKKGLCKEREREILWARDRV